MDTVSIQIVKWIQIWATSFSNMTFNHCNNHICMLILLPHSRLEVKKCPFCKTHRHRHIQTHTHTMYMYMYTNWNLWNQMTLHFSEYSALCDWLNTTLVKKYKYIHVSLQHRETEYFLYPLEALTNMSHFNLTNY